MEMEAQNVKHKLDDLISETLNKKQKLDDSISEYQKQSDEDDDSDEEGLFHEPIPKDYKFYFRELRISDGYDVSSYTKVRGPDIVIPLAMPWEKSDEDDIVWFSKYALNEYNKREGTSYEFVRTVKANVERVWLLKLYITFEAKASDNPVIETFQAKVAVPSWTDRQKCVELRECRRKPRKVSDITFSNININTSYYDPSWWGRAEPIYITSCPRKPTSKESSISDILFVNITATAENGMFLSGSKGSNLRFINMNLAYKRWTDYKDGMADYRPGCQGLVNHSTAGIIMEHIQGLEVENVNMRWSDGVAGQWNNPLDFQPKTVNNISLLNFHSGWDGQ